MLTDAEKDAIRHHYKPSAKACRAFVRAPPSGKC